MKLFIWDFHGTLEKGSEWAAHEITNRVLEEQGYAERMEFKQCDADYRIRDLREVLREI